MLLLGGQLRLIAYAGADGPAGQANSYENGTSNTGIVVVHACSPFRLSVISSEDSEDDSSDKGDREYNRPERLHAHLGGLVQLMRVSAGWGRVGQPYPPPSADVPRSFRIAQPALRADVEEVVGDGKGEVAQALAVWDAAVRKAHDAVDDGEALIEIGVAVVEDDTDELEETLVLGHHSFLGVMKVLGDRVWKPF